MCICWSVGCLYHQYAAASASAVEDLKCLPKRPSRSVLPALALCASVQMLEHLAMVLDQVVGRCRRPGRSKQRNLYSWEIPGRIRKRSMFLMKLSVACYKGDIEWADRIASAKYLSAYLFLPSTLLACPGSPLRTLRQPGRKVKYFRPSNGPSHVYLK